MAIVSVYNQYISENYTQKSFDQNIFINTSQRPIVVNLLPLMSLADGTILSLQDFTGNGAAHNVLIKTQDRALIGGQPSFVITSDYGYVTLIKEKMGWVIQAQTPAGAAGITPITQGGTSANNSISAFNNLSPLSAKGDLLTYSTQNVIVPLGPDGYVLTADASQPSGIKWNVAGATSDTAANIGTTGTGVFVTKSGSIFQFKNVTNTSNRISVADDTIHNTINLDVIESNLNIANQSGTLTVAHGGTGQVSTTAAFNALSPLTTKGDVLGYTTVNTRVGVGSNGTVLTADSTQNTGLTWAPVPNSSYTAANIGTTGTGVYATQTGNEFKFKNVTNTSNRISVADDTVHNTINLDVIEANLNIANQSGTLAIAHGGTGNVTSTAAFNALAPTSVTGDLIVYTGGTNTRFPVGPNGTALVADSTQNTGLTWTTVAANVSYTAANIGTTGVGVYATQTGNEFKFKNVSATSSRISVADDIVSGTIDLDVVEANLNVANMSGTLTVAHGGTGSSNAATAFNTLSPLTTKGDVLGYSTLNARVAIGSNGQVLTVDTTQATSVTWNSLPNSSYTAANVGLNGVGVYDSQTGNQFKFKNVTNTSNRISVADDTTNHAIDLDVVEANLNLGNQGGTVTVVHGGTGVNNAISAFNVLSPLTTKGDIIGYSTLNARVGVGANGTVLTADSTQNTGLTWAASGSGSSLLTTKGDLLTYGAALTRLAIGTDGFVLTADSTKPDGLAWEPGGASNDSATNLGSNGVGVFVSKNGSVFQFKNVSATSTRISVADDLLHNTIDLDVVEANLNIANQSGTLAIVHGGTGNTTSTTAFNALAPTSITGDLIVYTGSSNARFPVGSNGRVLTVDTTQPTSLTWSLGSNVSYTAANIGTTGVGVYATQVGNQFEFKNVSATSARISVADDTIHNTINLDVVESALNIANMAGTLTVVHGGTGVNNAISAFNVFSPLGTKGDLLAYNTSNTKLAVGADTYVLTANSNLSNGLAWSPLTNATLTSVTLAVSLTGSDSSVTRPATVTGGDWTSFPFQTIQAAINALPSVLRHLCIINIGPGTFPSFNVPAFSGSYPVPIPGQVQVEPAVLRIIGTSSLMSVTSGSNTGTAGSGTTFNTIKKPTAASDWPAHTLRGNFFQVFAGAGSPTGAATLQQFTIGVIQDNTVDTLNLGYCDMDGAITGADLAAPFAIDNTSQFKILSLNTTITGVGDSSNQDTMVNVIGASAKVQFEQLKFTDGGHLAAMVCASGARAFEIRACEFLSANACEAARFITCQNAQIHNNYFLNTGFISRFDACESVDISANVATTSDGVLVAACSAIVYDTNSHSGTVSSNPDGAIFGAYEFSQLEATNNQMLNSKDSAFYLDSFLNATLIGNTGTGNAIYGINVQGNGVVDVTSADNTVTGTSGDVLLEDTARTYIALGTGNNTIRSLVEVKS